MPSSLHKCGRWPGSEWRRITLQLVNGDGSIEGFVEYLVLYIGVGLLELEDVMSMWIYQCWKVAELELDSVPSMDMDLRL